MSKNPTTEIDICPVVSECCRDRPRHAAPKPDLPVTDFLRPQCGSVEAKVIPETSSRGLSAEWQAALARFNPRASQMPEQRHRSPHDDWHINSILCMDSAGWEALVTTRGPLAMTYRHARKRNDAGHRLPSRSDSIYSVLSAY